MSVEEFFDRVISVKLPEDRESLDIIDQTLLPGTVKRINLHTKEELWEAIKKLRVRGAPAIGVAAAEGLAVLANKIDTTDQQEFYRQFKEIADYLATSRPTAVNLFWALDRMRRAYAAVRGGEPGEIRRALRQARESIHMEYYIIEDDELGREIANPGEARRILSLA